VTYRLLLAYRGGAYAGWQRQTNAIAVQQRVEEALGAIVSGEVVVHGAGRTDAGVHAAGQVAHFGWPDEISPSALVHGVNHHLPEDVRVLHADQSPPGFHARKSAVGKRYVYRVVRAEVLSPLDAPYSIRLDPAIDVDMLQEAARIFVGRHDFTAFATSGGSHNDPHRTVTRADWLRDGADLAFRVEGDGFLRGMVRAMVGTLLEVGRGRRSIASLRELLDGAPRSEAGPNAPPQGLRLDRVFYPPGQEFPSAGESVSDSS